MQTFEFSGLWRFGNAHDEWLNDLFEPSRKTTNFLMKFLGQDFPLLFHCCWSFFYHKSLIVSNSLKSCCIVSIVDPQGSYLMGILVPWSCETNSFLFSWPRAKPLKLHHGRKLRISDTQKRRYHSIRNFYVPSILACSFQSSTPSRMLCLRWCQGGNQCHGFGITDDFRKELESLRCFPLLCFYVLYKTLDSSLRCLPGWW